MSLELALQENTAAANALTAALLSLAKASQGTNTSVILANDKTDDKTEAKTETKPKSDAKAKAKPEPKVEKAPELTYGDVGQVLLELAQKDRPALVGLLKSFGVAKGSELTSDQFAEVLEKAKALLNPAEAGADDDLV